MRAYYNDHDPQKCAWLRELIKASVITDGDVDERDIQDVKPSELVGYERVHFCAGIGVWDYALNLAGWTGPVWTASLPCPGFSCAGKGGGFDDPRHLWPVFAPLVRECRPRTLFGEQADDAVGFGWLDLVSGDLEAEGYAVAAAVLGAHSVGAPHIRQRLYFCAHSAAERFSRRSGGTSNEVASPQRYAKQSKSERLRNAGERAHAERDGGRADLAGREPEGRTADGRDSATGDGSDPTERGLRIDGSAPGLCGHAAQPDATGSISDPGSDRSKAGIPEQAQGQERLSAIAQYASDRGCTRGFWADCDWWYGRDGKYRPIESGLFPLAHGSAARVLRLRGYGDAVVAPLAAEFICAAKEAICESGMILSH
jgi:DNA (cytosine-5)-methyltransferase 1